MNSLPVIIRELRAEARNPATFSMRLAAPGLVLGMLTFLSFTRGLADDAGGELFRTLHIGMYLAIWLLVPLMAADCISRERREGTLGLLFLTPLAPLDIVVAKSLVHMLRAGLAWLAVLPVLAVPLLLGGVSGTMILCSLLVNATALGWAMAAGLVASAFSRRRMQALTLAGGLAFLGFCGAALTAGWSVGFGLKGSFPLPWGETLMPLLGLGWEVNFTLNSRLLWEIYSGQSFILMGGNGLPTTTQQWAILWICGRPVVVSLMALFVAVLLAGRAIRLNWQEKPPSRRYLWFLRVFCEPLFWRSFFNRWIRRKLEKNPIGWLEQRSWVGRTAVGAWVAVVASFYISIFSDNMVFRRAMTPMQFTAGMGLALAMTVVAAGSFRRERELGVMELLLITPQPEGDIALGRLRGIWEQFAPAMGLLLGIWLWASLSFGTPGEWQYVLFFAATFMNLPVTGLYQSLKQRGLLAAMLWTLWLGVFLPLGLLRLGRALLPLALPFRFLSGMELPGVDSVIAWLTEHAWLLPALWQLGCARWYWQRLRRTLKERSFPMEVQ